MTNAEALRDRGAALVRLQDATRSVKLAHERQDRLMREALAAGCSLRQIAQAMDMSWTGVRYRLGEVKEPMA